MRRKCRWLTSAMVLWAVATAGQDLSTTGYLPLTISGAFYYEFPQSFGFNADFDVPAGRKTLHRTTRKGMLKHRSTDYYLSGHLGFYRYAFNHSAVWVAPGASVRHSSTRRFYWGNSFYAGVFRTFYDGKVYSFRPNGSFYTKDPGGRFYAITGLDVAIGCQMGPERQTVLFLRPGLCVTYPYNSFLLPHFSMAAGVRVQPLHWKRRVPLWRKYKHAWL